MLLQLIYQSISRLKNLHSEYTLSSRHGEISKLDTETDVLNKLHVKQFSITVLCDAFCLYEPLLDLLVPTKWRSEIPKQTELHI